MLVVSVAPAPGNAHQTVLGGGSGMGPSSGSQAVRYFVQERGADASWGTGDHFLEVDGSDEHGSMQVIRAVSATRRPVSGY